MMLQMVVVGPQLEEVRAVFQNQQSLGKEVMYGAFLHMIPALPSQDLAEARSVLQKLKVRHQVHGVHGIDSTNQS